MKLRGLLIAALFIGVLFSNRPLLAADGSISMKIVAANTTSEKKAKVPIRQDLPKEIRKEDIVEPGGMEIRYDESRSMYYLYSEADLEPKTSKNFTVVIRDVWQITDEDFNFVKSAAEQRLESLKGKDNYDVSEAFRDNIVSQLDQIKSAQASQKEDIQKRMEFYRVNMQKMKEMRQQVALKEDFVREAHRFADEKEQQKNVKTMKFIIEAKNPSSDEPVEGAEVNKYLPEGVHPEHVVDRQDFEIKYDMEKNLYYLTKTIDLKPAETKKFEVLIMHLTIPDSKLDVVDAATKLVTQLAGSAYEKQAAYLLDEIKQSIDRIKESQEKAVLPEDMISAYSNNLKKVKLIEDDLEQIRRMIDTSEKVKVQKNLKVAPVVKPDVVTTWSIIYATIVFLAVISSFFYFLWWGQAKAKQGQTFEEVQVPEKTKDK